MAKLVDIPFASRVLNASLVTYSNEAKIRYLGVSRWTIAEYDVVSEEVAEQMAVGVAKANGAQVGVGITGNAGPTAGRKPVGTVCFGVYVDGNIYTATRVFDNKNRNDVRESCVEFIEEVLENAIETEEMNEEK